MRCVLWLVLAACVLLLSCASPAPEGGKQQLIVIGDSVAVGPGVQPDQAWPAVLVSRAGYDLADLAVGGSSSDSVIKGVINWPSGRSQPQLAEATSLLAEADAGRVAAVALGIGVNDWLQLQDTATGGSCVWNPVPACDPLFTRAMDSLARNLLFILSQLRSAMEPNTPLLVMTYYDIVNPQRIEAINEVILNAIAEHDASLIDAQSYYAGREHELVADLIHPSITGHLVLADIFGNALPPDTDGDGLSDVMESVLGTGSAVQDTDEDGCSDGQEFGPFEATGGRRDPLNPWDFYDTNGDGIIDLSNDVFEVIQHYAPTGAEPEYDVQFDRGPSTGPNVWNMTAPDGVIDLSNDIFGVIQQYLHDCG